MFFLAYSPSLRESRAKLQKKLEGKNQSRDHEGILLTSLLPCLGLLSYKTQVDLPRTGSDWCHLSSGLFHTS